MRKVLKSILFFLKKIKNKLKIKTHFLSFDFRAIGASKKLAWSPIHFLLSFHLRQAFNYQQELIGIHHHNFLNSFPSRGV